MDDDVRTPEAPRAAAFAPSEAYYRALVESSLDVVVVYNADGTFRYVSPSVRTVFGLSLEDVVGRPGIDFVHPDDVPALRRAGGLALACPGKGVLVEVRLRHRDGSYRTTESLLTNFLSDPAIAGLVVSARDVTEARETAAQLAHAQRMEAVGSLAESIAHAFKNALSVVVGHAELLLAEHPPGDASRPGLLAIHQSATRAEAVARRLLGFGRRERGGAAEVDPAEAVSRTAALLSPVLGAAYRLEVRTGSSGSVRTDSAELEEALVNLVLNARDAMPDGGTVTLSASDALVDDEEARHRPGLRPGDHVLFSVRDTGPGIPPEVMPRLFTPFFTTKGPEKGTGLGLSSVYGFARRSGGAVWAESRPGEGAAFHVCLPRAVAAEAATAPRETASAG